MKRAEGTFCKITRGGIERGEHRRNRDHGVFAIRRGVLNDFNANQRIDGDGGPRLSVVLHEESADPCASEVACFDLASETARLHPRLAGSELLLPLRAYLREP